MAETRRAPFDFPHMEEEILRAWKEQGIFQQTLEKPAPNGSFVFYEGPPTANGKPGIHHVLARTFKDLIPRYKTMRGYRVLRKAGWDTHGLPVEIAVEKELGLTSKRDIEAYGVEAFNRKCRESVWKYKQEWERLTERMAYWVDLEHPYITYEPQYVESLWSVIKQIWDKQLLYQSHRVAPYCPRCGTALSSHEMAQGYKDVPEESVYVKFELVDEPKTYVLAWTTTPWTLPGNVALAVGNDIRYVKTAPNSTGERYIVAADRLEVLQGTDVVAGIAEGTIEPTPQHHFPGSSLAGKKYKPLFDVSAFGGSDKAYTILAADFVTTDEGTGVVHTSVMYGEDDYQLGVKEGLPQHHTVDATGRFTEDVPLVAGQWFKDAEEPIKQDLEKRGLLYKRESFTHSYPHCWRCDTPLMYYARVSWYIRMSALRGQLLKNNETINWIPGHLKDGRFGEWLREVKDWAFSRERYWGTPLPIWESEDSDRLCIGSFDELRTLAKDPARVGADFDPHRPFVDDIVLVKEGKEYHRVKELCDVWFDSGSMPFAQAHYPFENAEWIDEGKQYPADFISEAIDQTRGWFYTLLAVSTLLGKGASYRTVITLGHVNDAHGQKMSKSRGNIVDPWTIIDRYGVDALRWHFTTMNQPGDSKNFDEASLVQVVQKHLLILMNVLSFYQLFAKDQPAPPRTASHHMLDRWVRAELAAVTTSVTEALDRYDILEAGRMLQGFVDQLSTWYIRRSRDRFKSVDLAVQADAVGTLHEVLLTVAKLLAPFMPFLAEHLYRSLGGSLASVHLESWPTVQKGADHPDLRADMQRVRALVEAGHALRAKAGIRVRQPLAQLHVRGDALSDDFTELALQELNVQDISFVQKLPTSESWIIDAAQEIALDTQLTDDLRNEGTVREVIRHINAMRKDAGLTPGKLVTIMYHVSTPALGELIQSAGDRIARAGSASALTQGDLPEDSSTRTVTLPQGKLSLIMTADA